MQSRWAMLTRSCRAGGHLGRLLFLGALPFSATTGVVSAQSTPTESGLTLDEAISRMLTLDAGIARAVWAVDASQGALMRAEAAFDLTLMTSVSTESASGTPGAAAVSDGMTEYDLTLAQRLRGGVVFTPQITLQSMRLPTPDLASDYNVADMRMGVTVPLLRGRGGGLAAAANDAARRTHQASALLLEHQKGISVLSVVQAYWNYAAAAERLAVLQDAETRAGRLVEEIRTLIAADERPAADEVRVRANYESKRANRFAAEGALGEARAALAAAMGVAREVLATLPLPATRLPDLPTQPTLPTATEAAALALERRPDLTAAKYHTDAAARLLVGARTDARPQFDLSVGLGYMGATTGSPLDALGAGQGLSTRVEVRFGLPFQNRDAAGLELQEQTRLRQAEIDRRELARQISIDAAAAVNRLESAAARLSRAREAARLFDEDVRNEEARYRLGVSTLFDLFFAQDALTAAELGELDARLGYASSLARLRFATGTLFVGTGNTVQVDVKGLLAWTPSGSSGDGGSMDGRSDGDAARSVQRPGRTDPS